LEQIHILYFLRVTASLGCVFSISVPRQIQCWTNSQPPRSLYFCSILHFFMFYSLSMRKERRYPEKTKKKSWLIRFQQKKHIEIDYHLIRYNLKHDTITLPFVSSSLQITNFFTKSHLISHFRFLVSKLSKFVAAASWVQEEMLRNIFYFVLFIKGRIIFLF